MHPRQLQIKDYFYDLPESRIARYPLSQRDQSKLLICEQGNIIEDIYRNVADHIPSGSLLVFNNTKVIQARLFFNNKTGARIEIFCLDPAGDNVEMVSAMSATGKTRWNCLIGKANKWKEKILEYKGNDFTITAEIVGKTIDAFEIEFKWEPGQMTFAEILDKTGMMPIPPYLKRESEEIDLQRYQTVYARYEGSVAAPTAGLHFTPQILDSLKQKNVQSAYVTLHVGAGTFKPVKAEMMEGHEMHAELIDVNRTTIEQLLGARGNNIVAVGTTSLRTIETLYWMGLKAKINGAASLSQLEVKQWDAYESGENICSAEEALQSLLNWMETNRAERLLCKTQILIVPGYELKVANGLITNFHQPGSTLLLLVASIVGNKWKDIYNYAAGHNFRFLSYGDGSLLWYKKK